MGRTVLELWARKTLTDLVYKESHTKAEARFFLDRHDSCLSCDLFSSTNYYSSLLSTTPGKNQVCSTLPLPASKTPTGLKNKTPKNKQKEWKTNKKTEQPPTPFLFGTSFLVHSSGNPKGTWERSLQIYTKITLMRMGLTFKNSLNLSS